MHLTNQRMEILQAKTKAWVLEVLDVSKPLNFNQDLHQIPIKKSSILSFHSVQTKALILSNKYKILLEKRTN